MVFQVGRSQGKTLALAVLSASYRGTSLIRNTPTRYHLDELKRTIKEHLAMNVCQYYPGATPPWRQPMGKS